MNPLLYGELAQGRSVDLIREAERRQVAAQVSRRRRRLGPLARVVLALVTGASGGIEMERGRRG